MARNRYSVIRQKRHGIDDDGVHVHYADHDGGATVDLMTVVDEDAYDHAKTLEDAIQACSTDHLKQFIMDMYGWGE